MDYKPLIQVFITSLLLIFSAILPAYSSITHPDSTYTSADSIVVDTLISTEPQEQVLDAEVHYTAEDSMKFELKTRKVFLYGGAHITYKDIKLKADYIEIDWTTSEVYARGVSDSLGKVTGKPEFTESDHTYKSEEMRYNFETKKGKIKQVITQEGDGYIHGKDVKKVNDSTFFIKNGLYTTCNQEHPHFYIGTNKLKVIPDKKIVTGPACLVVADVPTPLAVPFGLFPNKKGRSTGILIPSYGESPQRGFFLKNGGMYFGFSDYFDIAIRGDIYSKGGWGLRTSSAYNKRYRYNGNLSVGYSKITFGEPEFPDFSRQTDFNFRWRHTQDPKASPSSNFSADVNVLSSDYYQNNSFQLNDVLSNTFNSNVSYSKWWPGSPIRLNTSARHTQNTLNKTVNFTVPDVSLNMSRVYPFKHKERVGKEKIYEKIGVSSTLTARNELNTFDSLLFDQVNFDDFRNGAIWRVPITTSYKAFKYFTLSHSVNGTGRLYYKTTRKEWDPEKTQIISRQVQGIEPNYDFNFNNALTTTLYGMYGIKGIKQINAIRHVMIPSLSFNYRPDFSNDKYGFYKTVQSDTNGNTVQYSIFEGGIVGAPPAGKQGTIGMNINNTLEMKINTPNDTAHATKKIKLLELMNIAGSYNLAKDSLKLSRIVLNARTTLFKNLSLNLTGVTFDPYIINEQGRNLDILEWDENKRLARFVSANFALNFNLKHSEGINKKPLRQTDDPQLNMITQNPDYYVDFNIPWTLNFGYNLQYNKPLDSAIVLHSIYFNGDVKLTDKWKIGYSSGYDFTRKEVNPTSINIYRDLHCWEMRFDWVPFGQYQSYVFNINVKSAILQDLKLSRRRNWYDVER